MHSRTYEKTIRTSQRLHRVACVLTGLCLAAVVQADYRILPHSVGGANDGYHPYSSLLLSSATLYGMTAEGGGSNQGVIFSLDAPTGSLPQTRLVPGQYSTIQAAIDAAQAGDTIQVAPGTYRESLQSVGKDTVLRSNDPNDPNVTEQTVFEGNGKGLFADSGQRLSPPSGMWSRLVAGDVNRDGRLEVITGSTIWLNDGQGRFSARSPFFEVSEPGDLAIVSLADLKGDGALDVFVAHSLPPSRAWLNNGNGTLRDSGVRLGSNCMWDVAVGDFNADGKPDAFLVGCLWGNGLSPAPAQVWLNNTPMLPARSSETHDNALSENPPSAGTH